MGFFFNYLFKHWERSGRWQTIIMENWERAGQAGDGTDMQITANSSFTRNPYLNRHILYTWGTHYAPEVGQYKWDWHLGSLLKEYTFYKKRWDTCIMFQRAGLKTTDQRSASEGLVSCTSQFLQLPAIPENKSLSHTGVENILTIFKRDYLFRFERKVSERWNLSIFPWSQLTTKLMEGGQDGIFKHIPLQGSVDY